MDDRVGPSLLLVCVLVTAGCGGSLPGVGGGNGGGGGSELTPAPVPTGAADYPPGITAEGVVSPEQLALAHSRAVENVSYRLRSNRSTYYPNGTLRSRIDIDLRLARNRTHLVAVRTAGPRGPVILGVPPARGRYWSNGSLYVSRLTRDGETSYSLTRASEGPIATWRYWAGTAAFGGESSYAAARYAGFFGDIPTSVVGRRTTNGTTRYRLRGEGAQSPSFAVGPADAVEAVKLTATVDRAGFIRSLRLRYRVRTDDGRRYRVDWRIRYSERGNVTVGEPPWLDRAVASERE